MSRIEPIKPAAKLRNPMRTKRNSIIAAIFIVIGSVIAINIAIKTLSGAHEYLVAAAPAAAGANLGGLPTRTISLNLGEAASDYLGSSADLDGMVLSQPIAAGDLLMKRDIVRADPAKAIVHLAISTKSVLPTKLKAGDRVDIWAAINDGSGMFGEPQIIAQQAQVYATNASTGLFGESPNKLEIAVNQNMVKPILTAVLHADAISVVALGGAQ